MQTTPPLSTLPLEFKMPHVDVLALDDGTPLYVIPRADEDLVTVSVYLRSGAAHDEHAGATAFAAELLTRGTQRMTAEEFDEAVEFRGCSIRASGEQTSTTLSGLGLIEHLDHLVSMMSECIHEPRFDEQELETLRGRWMSELSINQHDPDWLASQASKRVCFAGHPYAQSRTGTMAQMAALYRDQIMHAYQRLVRSQRVVIVAGPVDAADMPKRLSSLTRNLPEVSFDGFLPQAHVLEGQAVIAINADAVQSAFRIALPGVGYDHPDYPAVQLVANVLGGYTLARLFSILREEKGYTYGAYAVPSIRPHARTIDVFTSVGNEHTVDTIKTIADEVRRLSSQRIPDEELEFSRQQILGSFARSNETPQQTASLVWSSVVYGLPLDYYERHVQKLQTFHPEELVAAQQRYFDVSRWAIGCSGVPEILQPALEPYASLIDVWDPLTPGT